MYIFSYILNDNIYVHMLLCIHSRNSEAYAFTSMTCYFMKLYVVVKYKFIKHVQWHSSFNLEVLTLSEKLAEEEITIWNQIHCLPWLTNRLRERAGPKGNERKTECVGQRASLLAVDCVALFWKEGEQKCKWQTTTLCKLFRKKREWKGWDEGGGGTGLGGGMGEGGEKLQRGKKNPHQAIRLIFSQPGL